MPPSIGTITVARRCCLRSGTATRAARFVSARTGAPATSARDRAGACLQSARSFGAWTLVGCSVAPGYVATDLLAGVSEDVMKSIVGQIPVGRLGEADEVARCVTFLAADEAGWITGSTLTINGGQFMD